MKTIIFAATASALLLGAAPASFAQTTEQSTTVVTKRPNTGTGVGAVGGAAAGAVVAGPVGAVVGGVAGAVAGHTALDPPAEVRTYVRTQHVEPVPYDGQIVVGSVLPDSVTAWDIPNYDRYRWTYIHGQRLLIDRQTHKIVSVINDEG